MRLVQPLPADWERCETPHELAQALQEGDAPAYHYRQMCFIRQPDDRWLVVAGNTVLGWLDAAARAQTPVQTEGR